MRRKENLPPDQIPADKIEEALLKRALGFEHEELYQESVNDKKSGEPLDAVKVKRIRKTVPPDVRALLFWLKNRKPERWRERIDTPDAPPEYEFDDAEMNL